jgi:phosphate transport system permease protein
MNASPYRTRQRTSRRSARAAELVAGLCIRLGGVGTIASIALILVFLVWVVAPLASEASATVAPEAAARAGATGAPLAAGTDDAKEIVWAVGADGMLRAWRADDGALLESVDLARDGQAPGLRLTAAALSPDGRELALGFEDGRVRTGRIDFAQVFRTRAERPDAWEALDAAGRGRVGRELVELLPEAHGGQMRLTTLALELQPFVAGVEGTPVVALDRSASATRDSLLVLGANGALRLLELEMRENLLTGEIQVDAREHALPFQRDVHPDLPARVFLNEAADGAFLVWSDGRLERYDVRDPERAALAQKRDVVPEGARLTAAGFLIGRTTLVFGDSSGNLTAWFPIRSAGATTPDGIDFVRVHELASPATGPGWSIRAIAASARGRVLAAADELGGVRVWNVTNDRLLLTLPPAGGVPDALVFAPKEDALFALHAEGTTRWDLDLAHPEATLASLFLPVWYENAPGPEHVWQSSSGTDSFEPKLGMWPLVFGTLKATVYSMLFAVPIALLAALYTSQFLAPNVRAPIKAAVEMMASLPSVVLGFLAGVVIAPFVDRVVPAILVGFFTVPFMLLAGAQAVQLLPESWSRRVEGPARLALALLAIAIGCALAAAAAPAAEAWLFAGDLRAWLDGRRGDAFGGWVFLTTPVAAVATAWWLARALGPRLAARSADWSRARCARWQALVFLGGTAAALGLALALSAGLEGLGLDPRGGVFDTYVQRNSLIVGVVMGFAVIPIVFTIADDALSSVPAHLKLASIGAGATHWQTALRVVLPTAASGIFSAVMVGLGRAVGETMIVLMATGNTPVLSWNVFDGFRTLSANIAYELPEAVKGSTHYRTLFLAALCLFAITFVFNTLAEVVRQRYRRRAARL